VSDHQQPSWRQLYLNVLREKGIERITQAVGAAEAAIFARMQDLSEASDHTEEHKQLKEAADELLAIKTQKLGWPQP
jgi:hypothetical protein